jgi:glutamine cyclotransferase
MNINNIINILEIIRGFIMSDIYDAEAMRELDPEENYPSQSAQLRAIKHAIDFLKKLDSFTNSIVYFNSNKEV